MCSPGVVSEIAEPSSFSLFGTSGEMINFWNFRLKGSHYSLLFLFLSCFKQLCPVRKRGHKASPQQGEERRRTVAEPFKPLICSSAVLLIKKTPWKTHLHNAGWLGSPQTDNFYHFNILSPFRWPVGADWVCEEKQEGGQKLDSVE